MVKKQTRTEVGQRRNVKVGTENTEIKKASTQDSVRGRCCACGKHDGCSGDDGVRNHPRAGCSSGSVSDKFARKTSAMELDQWWRLMHRTATSVEMVTSTVERPRRQMIRHASEPLHHVQVAGSHCGQFGQRIWRWLRLECQRIHGFCSRSAKVESTHHECTRWIAQTMCVPVHSVEMETPFDGPRAPCESQGSHPRVLLGWSSS